jgi:hypothetical protein
MKEVFLRTKQWCSCQELIARVLFIRALHSVFPEMETSRACGLNIVPDLLKTGLQFQRRSREFGFPSRILVLQKGDPHVFTLESAEDDPLYLHRFGDYRRISSGCPNK